MDDQLATDDDLDLSVPRRAKFGVALLVIAIQVLLVLGLIRAFTPDFAAKMLDTVVSTFTVTVTTPPPKPPPPPPPPPAAKAPEPPGKSGSEGKRAVAKPIIAKARVPVKSAPAPLATNTGSAATAGAGTNGTGTGAGGPGTGTGSGTGGTGSGGGAVTKAVKIAGEINSARDYPIATRDLRINDYVIVAVSVGADGRPTGCRVSRASKDAQANTVTCQLALTRFRFKPATDAGGKPVASVYGWKQSWFY